MFTPSYAHPHPHWVELAGQRYDVELALNDITRAHGLMFRDSLAKHHGMLFIHDRQEPLAYWMKNCKISLDILFFDTQRHLVGQQRGVPPCRDSETCPAYPSESPARFVLEVNAGEAKRLHLHTGMTLKLDPRIPAPDLR